MKLVPFCTYIKFNINFFSAIKCIAHQNSEGIEQLHIDTYQ